MMPVEWPVAAFMQDRRAPARAAGRGRLDTARRDFFLDPASRLTEQERALMTAMLNCLIADMADELRAALPAGWSAANDEDNERLAAQLRSGGLLDEPALMATLLRRAEEEGQAVAALSRASRRDVRVLQSLVSHDNGPVAAAAMALVLAKGRRRDRLGQCLVTLDDLPRDSALTLFGRIAAALRSALSGPHGSAAADDALAKAVADCIGRHEPERSLDRLTADLVLLLDSAGRLEDSLLTAAAAEGEIAFLAHGLARRANVEPAAAFDELLSCDPARVMALLRMGGASRELAAGLLAGAGDLLGLDDGGNSIELFDSMSATDVEAARAWLQSSADYRGAVAAIEHGNG